MIKRCEICGKEFIAQRKTAKYCSDRCRKRNERGYAFAGELEAPDLSITMPESDVLAVIQQAHTTAADLSRASMYTPAPLCLKLRNVARKLEGALRGEGL